jgi:FkbH-like protein
MLRENRTPNVNEQALMATLESLLATAHPSELRSGLAGRTAPLSLAEVPALTAHARDLHGELRPMHVAVLRSYTSELLDPWLALHAAVNGLALDVHHAPFGVLTATPDSSVLHHAPAVTLLLLQRTDLHPAFGAPLAALDAETRARLHVQALARLREIVMALRKQPVGHLVVTLLPEPRGPALGLFDAQSEVGEEAWWSTLEREVAGWLRTDVPAATWLDLAALRAEVGRRRLFDARLWLSARFPFSAEAASELARRVVAIATVLVTPKAKVIALDADNTLWGGVVGEDGLDGIALGPDYPGNAFVAFQRRLLDLQQRGFVLALCSKNNLTDVEEVLRSHPHQLLREEHFAAMRVNWLPKPENLASLASELNLGLDSFLFVDDSEHECAAVREALPLVEVVQVPKRPVDIAACLDVVARLEVLSLTAEDRAKTLLYAQERQRQQLLDAAASVASGNGGHDFLARLQMRMTVGFDPVTHVARLAQLTQKTNQFNLTTRRIDEQRMAQLLAHPQILVADFSLADSFGDSGIVGLAVARLDGVEAQLDVFLMSCRVIGRCAGEAFLHAVMRELAARGIVCIVADYLPTPKNALVQHFLPEQGFEQGADGRWRRSINDPPPLGESAFPITVALLDRHEPVAA